MSDRRIYLFIVVIGGQHHTLVLSNENKPFAIGRKEYGCLGLGEVNDDEVSELRPINALKKIGNRAIGMRRELLVRCNR